MRHYHKSKTDIVFGILSQSIYRPWFWANYPRHKQDALRADWAKALARFTEFEIRSGLGRWINERGVDNPPTPAAFVAFMRPVHSSASRVNLQLIKQKLAG